jgi:2-polyprenyl-6-methoxyphenol hydroxylase-like FAD-dependent oxidoreductase
MLDREHRSHSRMRCIGHPPARSQLRSEAAFETFESHRKPRVEKVVAEGRRRGRDKAIVGPLQQKLRELMIRLSVPLFGRHGDRWLYDYEIAW